MLYKYCRTYNPKCVKTIEANCRCLYIGITRAVYELLKNEDRIVDYCMLREELKSNLEVGKFSTDKEQMIIFNMFDHFEKENVNLIVELQMIPISEQWLKDINEDLRHQSRKANLMELHNETMEKNAANIVHVISWLRKNENCYLVILSDSDASRPDQVINFPRKCYELKAEIKKRPLDRQKSKSKSDTSVEKYIKSYACLFVPLGIGFCYISVNMSYEYLFSV